MRRSPAALHYVFLFASIALLPACTTTQNIHGFHGKGRSSTYTAPYMEVFEAAKETGPMIGLDIKEENHENKYIVFGKRISLMSYGEIIGVYFDEISDNRVRVEVVSKPRVRTNIFAPNWEDEFLESLTQLLNNRIR